MNIFTRRIVWLMGVDSYLRLWRSYLRLWLSVDMVCEAPDVLQRRCGSTYTPIL